MSDSNELALTSQAVLPQEESLLSVIAKVATDPRGVNVEAMERLLAMKERIDAEAKRTAYYESLSRLQAKVPHIDKRGIIKDNSGGIRSRYALLEDVDRALRPLMAEEGFAIEYNTEDSPKGMTVIGKMSHRAGHSEEKRISMEVDKSGGKNGTQGAGSTVSYGRRYLLKMFLNLVEEFEDTDGNPTESISRVQIDELNDLLAKSGASRDGFMSFMKVDDLEDIQSSDFSKAVNALKAKMRGGNASPRS